MRQNHLVGRTDSPAEVDLVCEIAKQSGAFDAVPCNHWSAGGRGAVKLAQAVEEAANQKNSFKYLYSLEVRFCLFVFYLKHAASVLELKQEGCHNKAI